MNTESPQRRHLWFRILRTAAVVSAVVFVSVAAFAGFKYHQRRSEFINWDYGSIHARFGGVAEEDRLLEIKFLKEWEYMALKQTSDGQGVWLHVMLSKRHCGNWMLVDQNQRDLIRPEHLRYPDGVPHREGVSCFGIPSN